MTKKFLHVGCGPQTQKGLKGFGNDDWSEVRFDIDERVQPDIVGSLTDMAAVATASMDAVFSSHNIEHLYLHEVVGALREFNRVLNDHGFVVLTCPDLQSVCEAVANDRLLEPLYESPAGPISAIDILYGHRGFIANGNTYMAHKCGFTLRALNDVFKEAGFSKCGLIRRPGAFELWAIAFKSDVDDATLRQAVIQYFP